MSLLAVHRALILSFIALALVFGLKAFSRYRDTHAALDLTGMVVAGAVALLGVVYLRKASHLRRK